MASDEKARAFGYACKLLGYRQRSVRELRDRLARKGYSDEAAEETLSRLGELGYVSDGRYAEALVREALEVKHLGLRGAGEYLRQRGIGREEAERALSGYDELEAARQLVGKRLRRLPGELLPLDELRRLRGLLERRGHSYPTIIKVLKEAAPGT